jgi:hypothetical protein
VKDETCAPESKILLHTASARNVRRSNGNETAFAFDLFTCSSHFSSTNRRVRLRSVAVHILIHAKRVAQFVAGETLEFGVVGNNTIA